ncbi:hypothetical protein [Saccharothrix luteola]|uniref:hypothetical protein n=1 Tax=Saccharothrix luteola TaxID=2893018 RepID=UPI001E341F30|nr:hypothetical protein [Saccharothrix luteola]MCC8243654.1 hypothetical protein [Saccharothrix luteola]
MKPTEIKIEGTGPATASGPGSVSSTGVIIQMVGQPSSGGTSAQPPAQLTGRQFLVAVGAVTAFFLAVSLVSCFYDPDEEYTTDSGARPSSAVNEVLVDALENALRDCAKTMVTAPLNCPQAAGTSVATNQIVTWSLHGDPVDGHQMAWRDDHFAVRGNAVMTLAYKDYFGDSKVKTYVVGYQSRIDWKNDKATVGPLKGIPPLPGESVTKRSVDVSLDDLLPVVKEVFDECANATRIPPPPRCPQPVNLSRREQADWSFTGDPLLNVRMETSQADGLIRIHGSYASEVRYVTDHFGPKTEVVSGNFTVLAIVGDDSPQVLQILAN